MLILRSRNMLESYTVEGPDELLNSSSLFDLGKLFQNKFSVNLLNNKLRVSLNMEYSKSHFQDRDELKDKGAILLEQGHSNLKNNETLTLFGTYKTTLTPPL